MTVAFLAVGCNFYGEDGKDGRDGSLNMRVAFYDIYSQDWKYNEGDGPDGLNRHFYYTIDKYMDHEIERYLNARTFEDVVITVEREEVMVIDGKEVIVRTPLPNTYIFESQYGDEMIPHGEELSFNYSGEPSQITIYFVDSRFDEVDYRYPPVSMSFRVVFMWP
jgi:hypothetical protein